VATDRAVGTRVGWWPRAHWRRLAYLSGEHGSGSIFLEDSYTGDHPSPWAPHELPPPRPDHLLKELIDILRADHGVRSDRHDRRAPFVLYPLLMVGSLQAISVQTEELSQEVFRIGCASARPTGASSARGSSSSNWWPSGLQDPSATGRRRHLGPPTPSRPTSGPRSMLPTPHTTSWRNSSAPANSIWALTIQVEQAGDPPAGAVHRPPLYDPEEIPASATAAGASRMRFWPESAS